MGWIRIQNLDLNTNRDRPMLDPLPPLLFHSLKKKKNSFLEPFLSGKLRTLSRFSLSLIFCPDLGRWYAKELTERRESNTRMSMPSHICSDPATDSDTLSDGPDYEPISSEPDTSEDSSWINNGESYYPNEHISSLSLHDSNPSSPICNGFSETELGNGYFSLIPNGNMIEQEAIEEEEKDEREINASESAISTAFQEDEERRNAPLPAERSSAIIDAMRGVSFHGSPPPWVDRVPEDRWLEILRRSR
ncbi:uncharacterized protein LOC18437166 isoform X2 [Amborella trichopoda]|uniref:uncharacterized protein LOC18437166 isoform X2 n=1 Tax=Amborella trichopoda TaxID=13333 RepID=UPI0009C050DE|nr:uncharacterized protein LOC18437166 isoform X2 [Amborella trichopoda]|eukprot:XP_011624473.2 uncharacterized protein LOC18437166 isoform X2 [Amborella trichopoda]